MDFGLSDKLWGPSSVFLPSTCSHDPILFFPVVVCRPALPRDTADVLEFSKFIWNGHDYVKYVWDEWLNDPTASW